jgi:hypothetical protein
MATIAINGLGRIGRAAFKIVLETPELELRAINDLNAADDLAYSSPTPRNWIGHPVGFMCRTVRKRSRSGGSSKLSARRLRM